MKKIVSFLLMMVLAISQFAMFSGVSYAQKNTERSGYMDECGFTWSIDTVTKTLTLRGKGEMIDSSDYPAWLAYSDEIQNVVVEEGITLLESYCFYFMEIQKLTLPSTLEVVKAKVFYKAKIRELEIPENNSLRIIDEDSYTGLGNTEWFLNQPNGCVYIGDFLFRYKGTASANTVVHIKEGTRAINSNAFAYQRNITDFVFCDSIERIGQYAFVETGWYKSQPDNSVLYVGNVLYALKGDIYSSDLNIKDGTVSVAAYAFYDKTSEYNGYLKCRKIYFPSSVKYIDDYAFSCNDEYLEKILFEEDSQLEYIGRYAFYKSTKLVPALPDSVKYIGKYAFYKCAGNNTPDVLALPLAAEMIHPTAFHLSNFVEYSINETNPFYSTDENGILFNKDKTVLVSVLSKVNLEEYTVPDSVRRIEHYSFCDNNNIKRLYIPGTVKEIGCSTFCNSEFETVEISYGIKVIPTYAFVGCQNISTFIVPRSVEKIEDYAFNYAYIYDIYIPKETIYISSNISNYLPLSVHCYPNSTAYLYAEQNNKKIELIDEPDTTLLNSLIDRYERLNRGNYTVKSLELLDEAVSEVDIVTIYYTEEQVAKWTENITSAFGNLEPVPADRSKLEAAINKAESINRSYYTQDSLQKLDDLLEKANSEFSILNQTQADELAYKINEAILSLEYLPADYAKVNQATASAEKLDRILYSQATLAVLDQSITAVDYTLNITQQSIVDGFADRINSAISALKYAEVVLENKPNGVLVSATAKEIYPTTALAVDKLDPSNYETANFAVGGYIKSVQYYDINLIRDGAKIQPDGTVSVKIKIPNGVKPEKCRVYHVTEDPVDPLVRFASTLDGNYIVFETDHFSEFAVIEVETYLSGISITKTPSKLTYALNEKLDLSGMEVTALMSDGNSQIIADYDVSTVDTSSVGTKTVTVYYTFGENTKSASFEIVVSADKIVAAIALDGRELTEYTKKVAWYKGYSSESLQLECGLPVSDDYNISWSSDNEKVLVDSNGKVTNKGFFFPRKAVITVTVTDSAGNVISTDSITVRFYKFSFQLSGIQSIFQSLRKNGIFFI